jgi:hypothetical protein
MQGPVYNELLPVRRRQRWFLAMRWAVLGLLAGSVAALVLEGICWQRDWPVPYAAVGAVLLGPALLAGALGFVWGRSWHTAAAAVDSSYHLKDRAATALAFVTKPSTTVLHELQVQDAVQHLNRVEPARVVPLLMPRAFPFALGTLSAAVLALIYLAFVERQSVDASPPEPIPEIVAAAQRIEEDLSEFEELAKQDNNKELEQLVQELRHKVEEMKQPGVDVKEALAKLSEMQAALAAQQAQYNVGLVDGQLQALGNALSSAAALDGAGRALVDAKYEKAAQELEKLEDPQLDRKEAKALEEKLREVAKAAAECGLGQLSEAASDLADSAHGSGKPKFQKATKELAKLVRQHNRRKRVNELLSLAFERLNDEKGECQNCGGQPILRPYKSNSPSSNWGREISGNVLGNKTNLLSQRNLQAITGNPGEGPSDVETEHSAEGRQQAARGYKEVYQKYQRMSEAVLDSEPIPLGHRQTIRKYFQLIRPQEVDKEKSDGK